ncbi:hypothetical protein AKJ08_1846 [Vulgatibacter incomptus]|uniref:Uncharacterized protein n=1 Tax=Vulgatibacter incomptus TaxID=1391653 RepID=A0A0K1PEA2_9BACT|nr:hypothetical protein AKJ08_1846 [Vulgatibacter incomptus]
MQKKFSGAVREPEASRRKGALSREARAEESGPLLRDRILHTLGDLDIEPALQ